jgi:hypothetical protein
MPIHTVAHLLPEMSAEDYAGLVSSIRRDGLLEPIWTYEGAVIDGRHRLKACAEAEVEPRFQEWQGGGSLVEFVLGLNLHRRHLSSSQKAVLALEVEKVLAEDARGRQRQAAQETNQKRAKGEGTLPELIPEAPHESERVTSTSESVGESSTVLFPKVKSKQKGEAREKAASIVGTNSRYVSDVKKIAAERPDLVEEIKAGKLTVPEAKKQQKQEAHLHYARELAGTVVEKAPPATPLVTIGYEGLDPKVFIKRLKDEGVTHLWDVRDNNHSQFNQAFNGSLLEPVLREVGIRYVHKKLLGVPYALRWMLFQNRDLFAEHDDLLKEVYCRWVRARDGIDLGALKAELQANTRTALLCLEAPGKPCHRHFLPELLELKSEDVSHE